MTGSESGLIIDLSFTLQKGEKDVLVATDVASKGLDFPNIQHVINYDLPDEIENYVHRIGRTGRSGKTGVATTFINKNQEESILLDLKHLLIEAKQRIPPVLLVSFLSWFMVVSFGNSADTPNSCLMPCAIFVVNELLFFILTLMKTIKMQSSYPQIVSHTINLPEYLSREII